MNTALLSPPRIGQPWPGQGGIYIGVRPGSTDGKPVHLIAATADIGRLAWGDYGEGAPNASSPTDGAANTRALIAKGDHPAAKACAAHSADGHTDFYLPARRELQLAAAVAPEAFSPESWYWSSTQDSRRSAFCQAFQYGGSYWNCKDDELRVRPFRGFILESLGNLNPSTAEGGPAAIFSAAQSVPGSTLHEVLAELERAVRKFPTWPTDPLHAVAVVGEEFGELIKAMLQMVYEPHKTSAAEVRSEAVQTAAMALRLHASLATYAYRPGVQHAQGVTAITAPAEVDA